MMSVEKPSLWRVLSDASRIIRSNSLHFLALSLLFIFPVSLLNAIVQIQTLQPSPLHSHYRRLLSTVSGNSSDPEIPPLHKSHLLFQFLYGLLLLAFNLCSAASVTHSAFHGFHGAKTQKKLNLSSSLKSALSSFFPLLATRLVYLVIIASVVFAFGICIGFAVLGLVLLGFEIEPSSTPFMAVVVTAAVLLLLLFIYLSFKWFLIDPVVVAESRYGFEPFERSSKLVKGGRCATLLMMLFFAALNGLLSGLYSANLAGAGTGAGARCSAAAVLAVVAYAALSAALGLFTVAAKTVLFIHCKAANGEESEVPVYDKMGEVYVPLPVEDAGDQV